MNWRPHAATLADRVTRPSSRWHEPIATTPRHVFAPRWWQYVPDQGWTLRDGAAHPDLWPRLYEDRTFVTRIGSLHADHAAEDDHPTGLPTSSSTLPTLVVAMYRHALIDDDNDVLCVTGTGYGTALLTRRLGESHVTSIDVDPHLVDAARGRLASAGAAPTMLVCDITGPLPGRHDRIVSTVGLPGVPPSWLANLKEGGRLVTNLAGTGLVVAADKTPDGGAKGQVLPDRAGFMATRTGDDYPPPPDTGPAWTADADDVTTGRYPVVRVDESWELRSALALAAPGIAHGYDEDTDGVRTAIMVHEDGSWARATGRRGEAPTVHQAGPRRLWDALDEIRHRWLSDGGLPEYGAGVTIDPDGTMNITRGQWSTTIPPAPRNATAL
ncbi:protein-L-isoaspartate O-methyltransferase family protein [Embleya sp. NPDC001921]